MFIASDPNLGPLNPRTGKMIGCSQFPIYRSRAYDLELESWKGRAQDGDESPGINKG